MHTCIHATKFHLTRQLGTKGSKCWCGPANYLHVYYSIIKIKYMLTSPWWSRDSLSLNKLERWEGGEREIRCLCAMNIAYTRTDLKWATVTYYDQQWLTMSYSDHQWAEFRAARSWVGEKLSQILSCVGYKMKLYNELQCNCTCSHAVVSWWRCNFKNIANPRVRFSDLLAVFQSKKKVLSKAFCQEAKVSGTWGL